MGSDIHIKVNLNITEFNYTVKGDCKVNKYDSRRYSSENFCAETMSKPKTYEPNIYEAIFPQWTSFQAVLCYCQHMKGYESVSGILSILI